MFNYDMNDIDGRYVDVCNFAESLGLAIMLPDFIEFVDLKIIVICYDDNLC